MRLPKNSRKKQDETSNGSVDGNSIGQLESILTSSSISGKVPIKCDKPEGTRSLEGAKNVASFDQYGKTYRIERDMRESGKTKDLLRGSDRGPKVGASTTVSLSSSWSSVYSHSSKRTLAREDSSRQRVIQATQKMKKRTTPRSLSGMPSQQIAAYYALIKQTPEAAAERESSLPSRSYSVCTKLDPNRSAANPGPKGAQNKLNRSNKLYGDPLTAEGALCRARLLNEGLQTVEKINACSSLSMVPPRATLDPHELTRKLNQVSQNRRKYYVQQDSRTDSIELLSTSDSNQTLISLPEGKERDVTTSMRGLAGSMATLNTTNFELYGGRVDPLAGSIYWNQAMTSHEKATAQRKKCELKLPPAEVYQKDLIIDAAVDPVLPMGAHETVDSPGADGVTAVTQICDSINELFRELQLRFTSGGEALKSTTEPVGKERISKVSLGRTTHSKTSIKDLAQRSSSIQSKKQSTPTVKSLSNEEASTNFGTPQPSLDSFPVWMMYNTEELITQMNVPRPKKGVRPSDVTKTVIPRRESSHSQKKSSSAFMVFRQITKMKLSTICEERDEMGLLTMPKHENEDNSKLDNINDEHSTEEVDQDTAPGTLTQEYGAKYTEESGTTEIPQEDNHQMHPIVMTALFVQPSEENKDKDSSKSDDDETVEGTDPPSSEQVVTASQSSISVDASNIEHYTRSGSQRSQSKQQPSTRTANMDNISARTFPPSDRQVGNSGTLKGPIATSEFLQTFYRKMHLDTVSVDSKDEQEIPNSYELLRRRQHKKKETFRRIYEKMEEIQPTGPYGLFTKYSGPIDLESSESDRYSKSERSKTSSRKEQVADPERWENEMSQLEEEVGSGWGTLEGEHDAGLFQENCRNTTAEADQLIPDEEELRFCFPFAFKLSLTTSWWTRVTGPSGISHQITKEMLPAFEELREQLRTFLNYYEESYRRYENVYKWSKSEATKAARKLYVSPFLRPDLTFNQEPNRFTMSDEALSMKSLRAHRPSHSRSPGYTTASCYIESKKWWMVSKVRRYVLRRKLAQYYYERDKMMKLGLRKKPRMHSASLQLGCQQRVKRRRGEPCQRRGDTKKRWMELFMKRNIPKENWKALKAKYELASSLRYRQRHHWNPFDPVNRPSLDGSTRLGWYGRSLIRSNNVTFLGQFSRGPDHSRKAEVRAITDQEVQNAWQRDLMEMAYVTYGSQQHITEELQFLIIVSFWLGIVIDQFLYFIRFVLGNIKKKPLKKIPHHELAKLPSKHSARRYIRQSDATNRSIWNKMMRIGDKTIFMLKRHAIELQENEPSFGQKMDGNIADKHELPVSVPWYQRTQLKRTNERLLDGISLAYPDFYYLAHRKNKYYFVDLDEDDMKWFPIRYYDADTGEYNFISHDHPKWPDWKFLQMMSYNRSQDMNPINIYPWLKDEDPPSPRESIILAEPPEHDRPNNHDEYTDSMDVKFRTSTTLKRCSEKRQNLILMSMKECYDDEGNFRYILVNPIKFDKKRVDLYVKTIGRAPKKLGIDPHEVGLGDFKFKLIKENVAKKGCKLDPDTVKRIVTKYAASDESPRTCMDRRINIALDYWYRKAALIKDFLKVLHTYFSLTSIETLKKENFVPFPVPNHTMYCLEHMEPVRVFYCAVPYHKMSLRTRIAMRHRQRLDRRKSLTKKYMIGHRSDGKSDHSHARCLAFDPRHRIGYRGPCPICHKMIITHHPSLSLYIDFRSRHINSHKLHPERIQPPKTASAICYDHAVDYPEFKTLGTASQRCTCKRECHCGAKQNLGPPNADCYLHCKVPTILSIFQGQCVTKKKQESLIRYFARVLHFEHSVIKEEIDTRLKEDPCALDSLKYKREFLNELHDYMCGPSVCQTIGKQIRSLINYQEMAMKYNKRTILSSRFCKKKTGWPLKLATRMSEEERRMTMRYAHSPYPYTLTTNGTSLKKRRLSRKIMNNLYICWMDTCNRGMSLLSHMSKYQQSEKLYAREEGIPNLLQALKKLEIPLPPQQLPMPLPPTGIAHKSSATLLASPPSPPTEFDFWFTKFLSTWEKVGTSSSADLSSPTAVGSKSEDELGWLSSRLDLAGSKLDEFGSITPLMDEVDGEMASDEEDTGEQSSTHEEESSSGTWESSKIEVADSELGFDQPH